MLESLFFYIFAFWVVVSALMVITVKNPVHAVLWLIFAFFNSAGLILLTGSEFLGLTLIIVYVGAVAVLFLFVVMMLDINFELLKKGFWKSVPAGISVGLLFIANLLALILVGKEGISFIPRSDYLILPEASNTEAIGRILYTEFFVQFQVAGIILLVAMIGCISLTLRKRAGVRRQDSREQVIRTQSQSLEIKQVKIREGINDLKY